MDDGSLALACAADVADLDSSNGLRSMANEEEEATEGDGLTEGALNGLQSVGDRVPPFLSKLFQIVSQPATDHCVRWSTTGDSFVVADHHVFSKQVLPQFFKHSSLCSFIRQLNTYGFRKRTNMGSSSDQMEFFNEHFRRGHIDLLSRIKRTGQSKGGRTGGNSGANSPVSGVGPMRSGPLSPGLSIKPGTNLMHATKSDLMHVQGQVNALISEVRDMRTLMQHYMMEVDKRVNLFAMEMQAAGGSAWYPNGNAGAGNANSLVNGQNGSPAVGSQAGADVTTVNLQGMTQPAM